MSDAPPEFDLLARLLAIDGPSGDEGEMADWLEAHISEQVSDARRERLGDSVLAVRGERPTVAVFVHIDTTGYTLGYDKALIPIGGPSPERGDAIRPIGETASGNRLKLPKRSGAKLGGHTDAPRGSRWVYAAPPRWESGEVVSPYLDNRAGIWAALQVLSECPQVAVAFTTGEEHGGQGAIVCARRLFDGYGIEQALVSDITWHTTYVNCGKGVAVSLRDRLVPRRRFLDRVLSLAEQSGLPWQREIESGGGSDGMGIERSGVPMSWTFVGAPEKKPHTCAERLNLNDLRGMADMLAYLVDGLTASADR